MNFLKKIFSKSKKAEKPVNVELEKGTYLINKDKEPEYSYTELTKTEYIHIEASVDFLKEAFAPLLKFDKEPVNHPENLDEYLTVWGASGFGDFMGIDYEQHCAFLAYNFGQYLVDNYNLKWKTKSDGQGTAKVVRLEEPVEIELYPIDSTLRAIQNQELTTYVEIEEKLKRMLSQFGESKKELDTKRYN